MERGIDPATQWRSVSQKTARVKTLPQFMEALAGLKKANESASSRLF